MREPGFRTPAVGRSTPPYSAYPTFEAFLRRAAQESVPPRLDKALLQSWSVASGNESAMLTSLKALGLIDEEGAPTEEYRKLQLSLPRRNQALRRALEVAYPDLVSGHDLPTEPNRLHDYFVEHRGLRGQMVEKAVRFYRQLVAAVGSTPLPEAPAPAAAPLVLSVAPAGPVGPITTPQRAARPRRRERDHRVARPGSVTISLTLQVSAPLSVPEEELRQFFQRVRRAWEDTA